MASGNFSRSNTILSFLKRNPFLTFGFIASIILSLAGLILSFTGIGSFIGIPLIALGVKGLAFNLGCGALGLATGIVLTLIGKVISYIRSGDDEIKKVIKEVNNPSYSQILSKDNSNKNQSQSSHKIENVVKNETQKDSKISSVNNSDNNPSQSSHKKIENVKNETKQQAPKISSINHSNKNQNKKPHQKRKTAVKNEEKETNTKISSIDNSNKDHNKASHKKRKNAVKKKKTQHNSKTFFKVKKYDIARIQIMGTANEIDKHAFLYKYIYNRSHSNDIELMNNSNGKREIYNDKDRVKMEICVDNEISNIGDKDVFIVIFDMAGTGLKKIDSKDSRTIDDNENLGVLKSISQAMKENGDWVVRREATYFIVGIKSNVENEVRTTEDQANELQLFCNAFIGPSIRMDKIGSCIIDLKEDTAEQIDEKVFKICRDYYNPQDERIDFKKMV